MISYCQASLGFYSENKRDNFSLPSYLARYSEILSLFIPKIPCASRAYRPDGNFAKIPTLEGPDSTYLSFSNYGVKFGKIGQNKINQFKIEINEIITKRNLRVNYCRCKFRKLIHNSGK